LALLVTSSAVVLLVFAGGSLAGRVGAADGAYRQVSLFSEIYSYVVDNYVDEVDQEKLLNGAYEGLLGGLDPHGAYLTPAEVDAWKKGVGANASADPGVAVLKPSYGALQVVWVAPGSPAADAGIVQGDHIRRIDGRPLRDLSLEQALRLLRGAPGTSVQLSVLRSREAFKRDDVTVARSPRKDPAYAFDVDKGVAVLTVHDLTRVQAAGLEKELEQARSRGVEKLLVDLRNVVEGGPREAMPIVEIFASGPLLRLRDRSGKTIETLSGSKEAKAWPGPIAVLVNGATAGGAEALARLLQLRRNATVYGEATFGSGAEPKLFELPDHSGFLVSSFVWEAPTGEGWNGDGVKPDHVEVAEGRAEDADADQLRRVLEDFGKEQPVQAAQKAA
jgi:carboxyl-terminal processing protease